MGFGNYDTLVVRVRADVRPMGLFPRPFSTSRIQAPFSAPWYDTVDRLARELNHLDAIDRVIELAFEPGARMTRSGYPYAGAPHAHPGVILSFTSRSGPLSFPVDTFTLWQDNIRAIALALEALRKVDRYGVAPLHEQYRGWTSLPQATDQPMDARAAAECLKLYGGGFVEDILRSRVHGESSFRVACRVVHPDVGGTSREFQQVNQAREVLRRYWKEIGA